MQKGADTFKQLGLIGADLDMGTLVRSDLIPE